MIAMVRTCLRPNWSSQWRPWESRCDFAIESVCGPSLRHGRRRRLRLTGRFDLTLQQIQEATPGSALESCWYRRPDPASGRVHAARNPFAGLQPMPSPMSRGTGKISSSASLSAIQSYAVSRLDGSIDEIGRRDGKSGEFFAGDRLADQGGFADAEGVHCSANVARHSAPERRGMVGIVGTAIRGFRAMRACATR